MADLNRRAFTGILAAAPLTFAATPKSVKLGGPIFVKADDPVELAKEHRRLGYSAAYCPSVKLEDKDRIRAIRAAFAAEAVVIAEVGAWVNMLDPDSAKRAKNIDYVTQRLALAEEVGALNCVDIAGSYNANVWYGPHPKNLSKEFFDATVENCRKVIDAVKPKQTAFTVEMMGWSLPNSPDSYVSLIKAVDRHAFAVHLDICNGINSPERYYNSAGYITECFSKLGKWIKSCHAKDLEWQPEMNVHFVEVVPGRGQVDYRTWLRELTKLPHQPPLMLEHLKNADEYLEGRDYIVKTGREIGIAVG